MKNTLIRTFLLSVGLLVGAFLPAYAQQQRAATSTASPVADNWGNIEFQQDTSIWSDVEYPFDTASASGPSHEARFSPAQSPKAVASSTQPQSPRDEPSILIAQEDFSDEEDYWADYDTPAIDGSFDEDTYTQMDIPAKDPMGESTVKTVNPAAAPATMSPAATAKPMDAASPVANTPPATTPMTAEDFPQDYATKPAVESDDLMFEEATTEVDFFADDSFEGGVEATTTGADTFSIDFEEEEIRTVIRSIADLYNLNVVIPDNLSGFVSIKLREVTWPEVFSAILDPVGFSYIDDGRIIRIKSVDDIRLEPMVTEIFPLRFSASSDVANTVKSLVDAEYGGRVIADKRTNTLMVTERPSRLRQLASVIDRLDAAESQIMIEVKLAESNLRLDEKLGINWQSLSEYKGTIGNDASILTASTPAATGITRTFIPTDSTATRTADTFIFNAATFSAILSALDTETDSHVIASPNVVTMNNTKAEIHITQRRPVPNYTFNEQTGTFQIDGFEYMDIGVNLEVTPKAQEKLITLDIRPEVSDADATPVTFNSGNNNSTQIPVVNSRRSHSIVTMKSGYTLALGGLKQRNQTNTHTKVPVLGSIPGVGRLFTHKSDDGTDKNLIIFVTATQIGFDGTPLDASDGGTVRNADPRLMYEAGVLPKDVPGYKLTEGEKHAIDQVTQAKMDEYLKKFEARLDDTVEDINIKNHNVNRFKRGYEQRFGPTAGMGKTTRSRYGK